MLSHRIVYSDTVIFLLKINEGRYRRPNFVIGSASYASAKTVECEGSISSPAYMGNYYSRECKILNTNGGKLLRRFSSSYRKLLDRVAFRILSNINDGAPLRKDV